MNASSANNTASAPNVDAPPPTLGPRGEHLAIMVPTYNCAEYLRETLESLQAQGSKLEQAHIEVIDDCSTKDEPEAIVRELWPEQVSFHRHAQNVGPIANFNSCIERAPRPWIHILHGDDFMLPGAYEEFERCLALVPDALAAFARSVTGDAQGVWHNTSAVLGPERRGRLEYRPLDWAACPVQFAGALFSRAAIERVGRFDDTFCHVADWNLWWRLASHVPVAYSNHCVSFYRQFEGNHSSTLRRNGINTRESLEQLHRIARTLPANGMPRDQAVRRLYTRQYHRAKEQCAQYLDDPEAFRANLAVLKAYPSGVGTWRGLLRLRAQRARKRVTGRA